MKTKHNNNSSGTRLDREVERERVERVRHDDEKSGFSSAEDFRMKDARDSVSSSDLHRTR
jgi:hypothetical protein